MSKNSKEIWLQIWGVVKTILSLVFVIVVQIVSFGYDLAHLFDEDYQRKKRIKEEIDRKREWLQRARSRDILDDWRISNGLQKPESHQQAVIVKKTRNLSG